MIHATHRCRGNSAWSSRWPLICIALAVVHAQLSSRCRNLINLLRQISINGILAVGVTYVLLTGGVDLSLGSLVALTGVVAAHVRASRAVSGRSCRCCWGCSPGRRAAR